MKWIVFWILVVSFTTTEGIVTVNEYGIREFGKKEIYHESFRDTLIREFYNQDSAMRFVEGAKKFKKAHMHGEPRIDTIWIEKRSLINPTR